MKALPGRKRRSRGPLEPPVPRGGSPGPGGVHLSAHRHTALCVRADRFLHAGLSTAVWPCQQQTHSAPWGGGPTRAEVFESSPLPPGHAHSSVTRAPCASQAGSESRPWWSLLQSSLPRLPVGPLTGVRHKAERGSSCPSRFSPGWTVHSGFLQEPRKVGCGRCVQGVCVGRVYM